MKVVLREGDEIKLFFMLMAILAAVGAFLYYGNKHYCECNEGEVILEDIIVEQKDEKVEVPTKAISIAEVDARKQKPVIWYCLFLERTTPFEEDLLFYVQAEAVENNITYIRYSYDADHEADWSSELHAHYKKVPCPKEVK